MPEEEKKIPEVPRKRKRVYTMWALLIGVTIFISIILTGGIAYGVQNIARSEDLVGEVLVDGVRKFEISAEQWHFTPAALEVSPGDKVSFAVTSQDVTHGFSIKRLGVNLVLDPHVEKVSEVVIPPDMPEGVYIMYCSIFCGTGHPDMQGTILVSAPSFDLGKFLPYIATTIMAGMFAGFVVIGRRRTR